MTRSQSPRPPSTAVDHSSTSVVGPTCGTRGRSRPTRSQRTPPPTGRGRLTLSHCRGSTGSVSLTPNSSRSGSTSRWVGSCVSGSDGWFVSTGTKLNNNVIVSLTISGWGRYVGGRAVVRRWVGWCSSVHGISGEVVHVKLFSVEWRRQGVCPVLAAVLMPSLSACRKKLPSETIASLVEIRSCTSSLSSVLAAVSSCPREPTSTTSLSTSSR